MKTAEERDGNAFVCEFITQARWEHLPAPVQKQARVALLDALGATLIGTLTPIAQVSADYAVVTWAGTGASILADGSKASAIGAAFANACAANGIDIDDCGVYTKGHPGAQLFPASFALAEELNLAGAEMLTGMVVGYEVAHRAGRIWHETHEVYQACGSWGSVACAGLAANMMGLSPAQTGEALGIADYNAPNLPMMRDIDHPSMVKHGIGWGAMTGIISAQLAQRGFTGVPSLFGFPEYFDWVSEIGRHYLMVDGLFFKEYAACAWAHAAIDASRELVKKHRIRVEDIASIRIEAFHEAVRLGADLPANTEEAQFNVAWPLAVMLVDNEVGPKGMLEHRLTDPQVQDIAKKIELVESEEFNHAYDLFMAGVPGGKFLSASKIQLKDGRSFSSGPYEGNIRVPQGWSDEQVEAKFRWLLDGVITPAGIDELVEMVWHFEQVNDVSSLAEVVDRCRLAS